ncbi:MAG TPA: hydroxymethylbilane synthase [Smithellaceae bacterium]|nr:hydroxymethylbilane synthase [Smithellaceae bacterium]
MKIKIGTRGSKLAWAQADYVAKKLEKEMPQAEIEISVIRTGGDIMQDISLLQIGGKGVFVKEIEDALLAGTIDVAVHSMKDVPTDIPEGLAFAAILEREDARDILASRDNKKMEKMHKRARIGTGSLRRSAQLLSVMPDLEIVALRGNLDTRLKKIETENLDGIIVAAAGMKRMGLADKISQYLPVETMLPAVGQGALGLEVREADEFLKKMLEKMNHIPTSTEVAAERSFLRHLGGGCRLPIAALGKATGSSLTLEGLVASPVGSAIIRDQVQGKAEEAEELGKKLAQIILNKGGRKLLALVCV